MRGRRERSREGEGREAERERERRKAEKEKATVEVGGGAAVHGSGEKLEGPAMEALVRSWRERLGSFHERGRKKP
jgi:hypothetical protein